MRFMFLGHHWKYGFSLSRIFQALICCFIYLLFESNNKAEDDRQEEKKQRRFEASFKCRTTKQ